MHTFADWTCHLIVCHGKVPLLGAVAGGGECTRWRSGRAQVPCHCWVPLLGGGECTRLRIGRAI